VSTDEATKAHADLLDLPTSLWPYELLSTRVWQLRAPVELHPPVHAGVDEFSLEVGLGDPLADVGVLESLGPLVTRWTVPRGVLG